MDFNRLLFQTAEKNIVQLKCECSLEFLQVPINKHTNTIILDYNFTHTGIYFYSLDLFRNYELICI